jgi:hypothetical protein
MQKRSLSIKIKQPENRETEELHLSVNEKRFLVDNFNIESHDQ